MVYQGMLVALAGVIVKEWWYIMDLTVIGGNYHRF